MACAHVQEQSAKETGRKRQLEPLKRTAQRMSDDEKEAKKRKCKLMYACITCCKPKHAPDYTTNQWRYRKKEGYPKCRQCYSKTANSWWPDNVIEFSLSSWSLASALLLFFFHPFLLLLPCLVLCLPALVLYSFLLGLDCRAPLLHGELQRITITLWITQHRITINMK